MSKMIRVEFKGFLRNGLEVFQNILEVTLRNPQISCEPSSGIQGWFIKFERLGSFIKQNFMIFRKWFGYKTGSQKCESISECTNCAMNQIKFAQSYELE